MMNYKAYLRTSHWFRKRKAALDHYGSKCSECGYTKHLQVHHKTYANIGNEQMEDLQVLCSVCHKLKHRLYIKAILEYLKIIYAEKIYLRLW